MLPKDYKHPQLSLKSAYKDYTLMFNNIGHGLIVGVTIAVLCYILFSYPGLRKNEFVQVGCIIIGFLSAFTIAGLLFIPVFTRIIVPVIFGVIFIIKLLIELVLHMIAEINNRITKD